MKHIRTFENNPAFEEDPPEAEYLGRDVDYTPEQQLFTPVLCFEEYPDNHNNNRDNGLPDFDLVMDKTPEQAIWAVYVIDENVPDEYRAEWDTHNGKERLYDYETLLNFATDEFKANRWSNSIEEWNDEGDWDKYLIKLSTPDDVDTILNDLYNYLLPGHATYTAKKRIRLPFTKQLRPEEVSRVKRTITALIRYKKRIESNTVGGTTPA